MSTTCQNRIKEDGTIVTDADGAAQRVIYNEIYQIFPHVKITGEESDLEMMMKNNHPHTMKKEMYENNNDDDDDNVVDQGQKEEKKHALRSSSNSMWNEEISHSLLSDIQKEVHAHMNVPTYMNQATMGTQSAVPSSSSSSSAPPPQNQPILPSNFIIESSRVCVFVDPLDGTSSYAKGDYDAVTILIAIVVDNVPIFGVIAKPFGSWNDVDWDEVEYKNKEVFNRISSWSKTDFSAMILYGGSLMEGVYMLGRGELRKSEEWNRKRRMGMNHNILLRKVDDIPARSTTENRQRRAIISKSKMVGCVRRCIESLSEKGLIHPEPLYISGAGMKTMKLILGSHDEALWFFPKSGISLWDVAAADALLRVMGGKMTDGNGRDLDYNKGRLEGELMDGIIASIDTSLHTTCLTLCVEEQWRDIVNEDDRYT